MDYYDEEYDYFRIDKLEYLNRKKENPMDLGDKRYYMGTDQIRPSNKTLMKTLDEAIEDAVKYMKQNPSCDYRYIVKVVKVVRRRETPVVVEDID